MKIEITLNASDFLIYQLYASSKSKLQNKNRNQSRYRVSILYLLFSLFLLLFGKQMLALVFIIVAILWYLIYPEYAKRHSKKYFENYINENHKNKIGVTSILIFDENNGIVTIDEPGLKLKIEFSAFDKLIELPDHFFVKNKSGSTLIIPKRFILNHEVFKNIFSNRGVPYVKETNWKW